VLLDVTLSTISADIGSTVDDTYGACRRESHGKSLTGGSTWRCDDRPGRLKALEGLDGEFRSSRIVIDYFQMYWELGYGLPASGAHGHGLAKNCRYLFLVYRLIANS
jgi:hypothetical protein